MDSVSSAAGRSPSFWWYRLNGLAHSSGARPITIATSRCGDALPAGGQPASLVRRRDQDSAHRPTLPSPARAAMMEARASGSEAAALNSASVSS